MHGHAEVERMILEYGAKRHTEEPLPKKAEYNIEIKAKSDLVNVS